MTIFSTQSAFVQLLLFCLMGLVSGIIFFGVRALCKKILTVGIIKNFFKKAKGLLCKLFKRKKNTNLNLKHASNSSKIKKEKPCQVEEFFRADQTVCNKEKANDLHNTKSMLSSKTDVTNISSERSVECNKSKQDGNKKITKKTKGATKLCWFKKIFCIKNFLNENDDKVHLRLKKQKNVSNTQNNTQNKNEAKLKKIKEKQHRRFQQKMQRIKNQAIFFAKAKKMFFGSLKVALKIVLTIVCVLTLVAVGLKSFEANTIYNFGRTNFLCVFVYVAMFFGAKLFLKTLAKALKSGYNFFVKAKKRKT